MNDHITRNIDARRAQLNVTVTQLEDSSGMARQTLHRVKRKPSTASLVQLNRIAMLLYCPVTALTNEDPAEAARYPLPPSTWLETISTNRERYGFKGGVGVSWGTFTFEVNAAQSLVDA